jgi:hypothetical protein
MMSVALTKPQCVRTPAELIPALIRLDYPRAVRFLSAILNEVFYKKYSYGQ